jgi:vacuolar-type H+-ATPase subunit E/Vma4
MNKEPISNINQDNAEAICAKINQDADSEVRQSFERAKAQAQQIIDGAKKESEALKAALLRNLEKEIERSKERVLSTLNLEKKRLILDGKQKFVDEVIMDVKQKAGRFRSDPGYSEFLAGAIVEGMQVLDVAQGVVYYAAADEHIFNDGFMKKITDACRRAMNRECSLTLNKSDFKDIGVIVNSQDGRMMYDNRFDARLGRMYEDIYMELLKGAV